MSISPPAPDVRFHAEALDDLVEAAGWYEAQRPGLGLRLRDAVLRAAHEAAGAPEAWPRWQGASVDDDLRRVHVEGFPYRLVYAVGPPVTVLAVAHARRDPTYWTERAR